MLISLPDSWCDLIAHKREAPLLWADRESKSRIPRVSPLKRLPYHGQLAGCVDSSSRRYEAMGIASMIRCGYVLPYADDYQSSSILATWRLMRVGSSGGGTTLASNPTNLAERRELVAIGVLIEHPVEGLILFETGPGKDYPTTWGAPLNDIFAQINYHPDQELERQIEKTGHKMSDIKAVIMGHLHVDHAGGLDYFRGTDVPVYVHEQELKHAFYSVASKSDLGTYFPQHLTFDLNWTPFHGDFLEITQGLTLRHAPGHTPGLCILQANLKDSGTWIFTTDQYHVHENFEASHPQGWLARDHDDWVRSHQMVKMLQRRTGAKIIFGHCKDTFYKHKQAPHAYT